MSMLDPYATKLAQDWISTFATVPEGPAESNPFRVFEALVTGDPLYAWHLIREVVRLDLTKRSWDILAAGPLEDLLSQHGTKIIDYIADDIEEDAALRELLQGVRKFDTSPAVWARVKARRGGQ
jgi:hypothetical protein